MVIFSFFLNLFFFLKLCLKTIPKIRIQNQTRLSFDVWICLYNIEVIIIMTLNLLKLEFCGNTLR